MHFPQSWQRKMFMKDVPLIVTKADRTGALEPSLKKIEETPVHIRTGRQYYPGELVSMPAGKES